MKLDSATTTLNVSEVDAGSLEVVKVQEVMKEGQWAKYVVRFTVDGVEMEGTQQGWQQADSWDDQITDCWTA